MKLPSLAIRQQLATFLSGMTYLGKTIPVFEEYVQYTTTKPQTKVLVGNMQVEIYILLQNQTANDATNNKCVRVDECSVQIQAYAVYPANKGGSVVTEEMMQLVIDRLYTTDNLNTAFTLPEPFGVFSSEVITTRNTNYNTDTNRVWSTILVLNININQ